MHAPSVVAESPRAPILWWIMFTLAGLLTPIVVVLVLLIVANASVSVLRQYERAAMFTLGRSSSVRAPGLIFLHILSKRMTNGAKIPTLSGPV